MKNGKVMLFLSFCLILAIGMTGCSSSGSGGGSTTTTTPTVQTPTQRLVGTWNFVSSDDGFALGALIFRADGTGTFSGTPFTGGRVDNGVFYWNLPSGDLEAFDIAWSNNNNTIALTNHNGGATYIYNRAS